MRMRRWLAGPVPRWLDVPARVVCGTVIVSGLLLIELMLAGR